MPEHDLALPLLPPVTTHLEEQSPLTSLTELPSLQQNFRPHLAVGGGVKNQPSESSPSPHPPPVPVDPPAGPAAVEICPDGARPKMGWDLPLPLLFLPPEPSFHEPCYSRHPPVLALLCDSSLTQDPWLTSTLAATLRVANRALTQEPNHHQTKPSRYG